MNTQKIAIITYSQSPLRTIMPYFDNDVLIFDEKFIDFNSLDVKELWLDTYIDLYNPRLIKHDYLYQFFARIHGICDASSKIKKRFLRNFTYNTTDPDLYKVFSLYYSFVQFFDHGYGISPIYIPDVLNKEYRYHPYHRLLQDDQVLQWNKNSLFRVIHFHDIITNLKNISLDNQTIILQGIKINLVDMCAKINQVFGNKRHIFENAYDIFVDDNLDGQILTEINYNLESICIQQLQLYSSLQK